nr:hypothetical protein [uncultured Cohaesibacter sp.]
MAIRLFSKPAATMGKKRSMTVAPLAIVATLMASVAAHALEINSAIKKVDRTGAIELRLPQGTMVAIGDKVRVSLKPGSMSKVANKTRWTIKAVNDDVIVAIPDGAPVVMPEAGFAVQINTLANQPSEKKAAKAEDAPDADVIKTEPAAPVAKAPVAKAPMAKAAEQKASEQAVAKKDEQAAQTAKSSAPQTSAPAANEMPTEKKTPEAPSEPVAAVKSPEPASSDKTEVDEKAPVAPDANMLEGEGAKTETAKPAAPEKEETSTTPKAEIAPVEEKAKPVEEAVPPIEEKKEQAEAPKAPLEALDLKGTIPDVAVEPVAPDASPSVAMVPKPSAEDINECDRLAAHPFDPDAKGEGVPYASLKANDVIEACQQAIDMFPDEARFYSQLTRGLHKAGKFRKAVEATRKGAELGSGHSMAFLAVMYQQGQAVPKDQSKALEWFEKAAAAGNPAAMVFAAALYRDGTGTAQDYSKAAAYYQQAADLEVAEAMTSLAVFLDRGQGVEKDADEAARYFLKALKAKDVEARKLLYEVPGAISRDTRKQIQVRLKSSRFYRGPIDGEFGTGTRNALTLFRRAR